ncbi:hypothetical protein MLD38_011092 [Melastoma candidum]|uniref:Uncharacterized protein n=1 Tax=Melastoma candidum TaxID=119954 RepID=A0ACB9R3Q7_9MYRT|nr:hypothetical protein MLD38_011092 [Melastoma candidum]
MASLPFLLHPSPTASTTTDHHNHFLHHPRPTPLAPFSSLKPRPPPPSSLSSLSSSYPSQLLLSRVLTAPAECSSPSSPEFDLRVELSRLRTLRDSLSPSPPRSLSDKLRLIRQDPRVRSFFADYGEAAFRALRKAGMAKQEDVYLVHCLVACGQEHVLGSFGVGNEGARGAVKAALYSLVGMIERLDVSNNGGVGTKAREELEKEAEVGGLRRLLKVLREVESFYDCVGGIIGYQISVLELLLESTPEMLSSDTLHHQRAPEFIKVHCPTGVDLSQDSEYASKAALWGIEGLPELGEIYPLGGAADRLGLVDPDTGECLPAAMLPYCGRTLLEGLVRDLQAREYLYFKLYGKQCITPVAIMTSSAKNNHEHISSLFEKLEWFGRGRSRFQLFEQPLVPAINADDGQWIITAPLAPLCKPGGHGVIWKLAYDKGIFRWFKDHGRKGATVRQVSNVVAATDVTLLALSGIGLRKGKKLGFASCERSAGATEGINVLVEKKDADSKWAYGLSCIEYTEFEKFGVPRPSSSSKGLQKDFPANTNILYIDLSAVESIASRKDKSSLPGMVLNVKKPINFVDHFGNRHSIKGGRLECTMQNIADSFANTYTSQQYKDVEDVLDTFLVHNERRRVTSSAKKKRKAADKCLHQTPEGSLLDILRNARDLLSSSSIELPEVEGNEEYISKEPPFLILLHPALGPLWEITRAKFSGGSISRGSELKVEVAEFFWKDVQLKGSLIVEADNVMGSMIKTEDADPILQYGSRCGRCRLQNVTVLNDGIDWNFGGNVYWKNQIQRLGSLKVILHGNAEFEATDVTIQGNHVFKVPDHHRMKITPGISGFSIQLELLPENLVETGSWYWKYKLKGPHVDLELTEL